MKDSLFELSVEHWPSLLLGILPALINIGIFVYVLINIKQSRLRTAFLWFLFTLILWRMQEVVLQICSTREAAKDWYHLFSISTNFIGATGLHFVLLLVNKDWRLRNGHVIILYLPTLLFSMFFASGIDYMRFHHTKNWGWTFVPSHPVTIAAFILIGINAFTMLFLLALHTWRSRKTDPIKYKQLGIILIGAGVPIIIGCVWQIILPIFFDKDPVPIASSSTIFFSFAILTAITKYSFLEFSPIHQWDNIVENMNEGMLILDKNNIAQFVNHKFCEMLGYSKKEIMKKNAAEMFLLPPGESGDPRQNSPSLFFLRGRHELYMKKRNDNVILCEIHAQPYLNQRNEVVGCVGMYTDITAQREAENRMKDSENRYRTFVEEASDGIFLVDESGNYADVNSKGCQMLGYSRQELLSMNLHEVLFEEDRRNNPPKLDDLKPDRSTLSVRDLKRKDGSRLPVEINVTLLPDQKMLGIVRDITARKKTEEELLEKVKELDSFIYRASHDLRGPLASITGLTSIGREEIKDSQATFYFDKIYDSVNRLDSILQELSKLARVTQSQMTPTEINLDLEVFEIIESLKHLPNFSHIEFVHEINVPVVYSDRTLLIIVLQNLIINSINYYDEKRGRSFVRIMANEKAGNVEIVVSDNGLGIAAELQAKVFEMFYRGTTVSKGSGLGLYIVKNALKKLNGTIRLESVEGESTVFTITLPKPGKHPAAVLG